tara:strand:- start:3891 stop:4775 length:885 start_codon:yes stop_codon:yes gene_type:complete
MNILEAFIKKNKSIIIFISGINIELLNNIGDILSKDLNIPVIKISEYIENSFFTNIDKIDTCKLLKKIDNNKNYILVGFINPLKTHKYTFHYNIKFSSEYFKENKIKNSKEIYEYYKSILQSNKVDKFFKYNEKNEETINNIFNNIIENISNIVYSKKTIFKDSKIDNTLIDKKSKSDLDKDKKSKSDGDKDKKSKSDGDKDKKSKSDWNKDKKSKSDWDKDNLYTDIDKYTDEMLNIEVYNENDFDDNELFKEFEDDDYSPKRKLYFVNDFFYQNYKGGGIKQNLKGRRYLNN